MDELVAMLSELDRDEGVRCIVLGGNERAFAAGADIGELARSSAIDLYYQRRVERWDAIRSLWTPLVAAVSGFCLGGGCELAMSCDLIVASRRQFRATRDVARDHPGRRRHPAPDARGRQGAGDGRDPQRPAPDGPGSAGGGPRRHAWSPARRGSRSRSAWRARSPPKGPVATRLAKESVNRAYETTLQAGLEAERRALYLAFASEDAKEGLTAFTEKREPEFKGR